jgi:hypothetical protein
LLPNIALASAYRFGSPISTELLRAEAAACSRPLSASGGGARGRIRAGRCLSVDLAVAHNTSEGRLRREGVSYLLEQGFAERIALDFGNFAPVVLREIRRGLKATVRLQPDFRPLVRRVLRSIRRHVHYDVVPRVALPMPIELAVARLAARFHARARRPLLITSGPRTPEGQALAMYLKLNQGASLRRLYRKKQAAAEIGKAYAAGRRQRKRHQAIIADMAEVIRAQMQRGVFISPHLKGNAVDIRSRNLNRRAKAALRRAVASFRGMHLNREEKIPPHFHLEIVLGKP